MVTPNFCGVGSAAHKYWVSDIKLTGYEEDSSYMYGQFTAYFTMLTPGGSSDPSEGKTFNYAADWDWGESKLGEGYWTDYNSQPITPHGAGDLELEPGQAVLLSTLGGDGEHLQMFVTAGEVITAETNVPLNDGEFTSVGNPYPVGVWVSDLAITGYEEDSSFMYGQFTAYFTILTPGGSSDPSEGKTFNYAADWDWGESKLGEGYWTDYNSQPITPHGAGDMQLPAGQGVLFSTLGGDGEHPQILIFPELKLN